MRPSLRSRRLLVLATSFFVVSAASLAAPEDAAAIPIEVGFSGGSTIGFTGSLGVFDVVTGTETFLLGAGSYEIVVQGFGASSAASAVGGVAFQFTGFSSGNLIDTAPFDSVAYLEFELGDPFGPLGTGYRARLIEGNVLQLTYQVLGVPGVQNSLVAFTFTAVPEPSTAGLVGLGAVLLAWRRGHTRA